MLARPLLRPAWIAFGSAAGFAPALTPSDASKYGETGGAVWVHALAQVRALWQPVFAGVFALAVVAASCSRPYPGLTHCRVAWLDRSPPSTFWGGWSG